MQKFWTFVQEMTIWNWLTLIAFIFFPLSALNAYFSLRSRYLDWRGIKSKKNFERRMKQLEEKISTLENFENNPTKFLIHTLNIAVLILVCFLAGFFFFIIGVIFDSSSYTPLKEFPTELLSAMAIFMTFLSLILAMKLSNLVSMVNNPVTFAKEIVKFFETASLRVFLYHEKVSYGQWRQD